MKNFAVNLLIDVVNACINWWSAIIDAVDLVQLWIGVVVLVALFSIVLTPMRGGQLLGGGAIGTFTQTKINKKLRKSQSYHHEED